MTGRVSSSSQTSHSPAMSIDARAELSIDVLIDRAIVIGMSSLRHVPGCFRAVGDERLLTGNRDDLPTYLWQELGPMRLEPASVTTSALTLGRVTSNLDW